MSETHDTARDLLRSPAGLRVTVAELRAEVERLRAERDAALVEIDKLVNTDEDAEYLALVERQRGRALAAIERVKAIHRPFGIYEPCDCDEDAKDDDAHIEVDDVGLTCELMYRICWECCVENDYQREACAYGDTHSHGKGDPICPTIAALEAPS